jgi:spermidine synthase
MALETVLVLDFQTNRGVLFQDLGVLLMSFMAGLAAGSFLLHHYPAGGRPHRFWVVALLVAFAAVSGLVGGMIPVEAFGLPGISLMLAVVGFLTAAIFACASRMGAADQGAAAGSLYAADLCGGCLASLVASLILVPYAGVAGTALSVAALSVLSLLLL